MRLRTIEVMRGVAAMSVVFTHVGDTIPVAAGLGIKSFHHGLKFHGQPGVEFFFVLSGFVMALVHGRDVGQFHRIPNFLWSRFCRIYPLLCVVVLMRLSQYWGRLPYEPDSLFSWFTLLGTPQFEILPVVWTLKVELGFYGLFAAIMLPRVGPVILAAWVAVSAAFLLGVPVLADLPEWAKPPTVYLVLAFGTEFLAGLAVGALFVWRPIPPRAALAITIAAAALLLWRLAQDNWGASAGPNVARIEYGVGYGAFALGLGNLERAGWIRLGRWAVVMGALSYPIYLGHLAIIDPVVELISYVGRPRWMGQDVVFAVLVLVSVAGGAALAYGVDRPAGRMLRMLGRRFLPGSTPSSRPSPASPAI